MYSRSEVVALVLKEVQAIMPDEGLEVTELTFLPDLKGFDSLLIVNLLERLEMELDIEVDAALLLPEAFETPQAVADLFITSQSQGDVGR
ncbi:MAG TPA: phosphopantetheine-binding protein [Bacilli bacterium]|nr:phosphopantetheine-binding protein [Bacilli bacterium]